MHDLWTWEALTASRKPPPIADWNVSGYFSVQISRKKKGVGPAQLIFLCPISNQGEERSRVTWNGTAYKGRQIQWEGRFPEQQLPAHVLPIGLLSFLSCQVEENPNLGLCPSTSHCSQLMLLLSPLMLILINKYTFILSNSITLSVLLFNPCQLVSEFFTSLLVANLPSEKRKVTVQNHS